MVAIKRRHETLVSETHVRTYTRVFTWNELKELLPALVLEEHDRRMTDPYSALSRYKVEFKVEDVHDVPAATPNTRVGVQIGVTIFEDLSPRDQAAGADPTSA